MTKTVTATAPNKMTWAQAASIIALGLTNGTEEGKRLAMIELTKLGKIGDLANDMTMMLQGINDRLDIESAERHAAKVPDPNVFPCSACRFDIQQLLARARTLAAS